MISVLFVAKVYILSPAVTGVCHCDKAKVFECFPNNWRFSNIFVDKMIRRDAGRSSRLMVDPKETMGTARRPTRSNQWLP